MKFPLVYLIIALLFLNTSCSKEKEKISIVEEESLEMQMIRAYNDGLEELDRGDVIYAAKKFNEAELLYPQSVWAVNIMCAILIVLVAVALVYIFKYDDCIQMNKVVD